MEHLLTGQVREDLDRLLRVDAGLGMTRLAWLTTPAVDATAAALKTSIEKLAYLRGMDAHRLDLSMVPAERRRFLATVGRRSTNQALERRDPDRRYPIMLALVAQSAADQLDEVVALFDRAVSARESRAKSRTEEELAERARRGETRHLLMDVILPVLADHGDTTWTEWRWSGTRSDGQAFEMRGVTLFEVTGGQIAGGRLYLEDVERDVVSIEQAVEDLSGRRPRPAHQ